MSTNARIGIKLEDGSILSAYHHWDGYPEWLGVVLKTRYETKEKVAELLDGGNMSSCWSDNVYDYDKQEFVKRDPQPEYYGGDSEAPHHNISFQRFLDDTNAGEEFLYFFGKAGWKAYSTTPVYDENDKFIANDIQPVEIPEDEEVAVA